MAQDSTMNALIGGIVTVVLSFTGFSPLIGGAVAGYLNQRDGVRVGALSGLVAMVPVILLVAFAGTFFAAVLPFSGMGPGMMTGGFIGLVFGAFLFALLVAFVVGLSALGGYIGEYLYTENVF
jgi:hypothetical protein